MIQRTPHQHTSSDAANRIPTPQPYDPAGASNPFPPPQSRAPAGVSNPASTPNTANWLRRPKAAFFEAGPRGNADAPTLTQNSTLPNGIVGQPYAAPRTDRHPAMVGFIISAILCFIFIVSALPDSPSVYENDFSMDEDKVYYADETGSYEGTEESIYYYDDVLDIDFTAIPGEWHGGAIVGSNAHPDDYPNYYNDAQEAHYIVIETGAVDVHMRDIAAVALWNDSAKDEFDLYLQEKYNSIADSIPPHLLTGMQAADAMNARTEWLTPGETDITAYILGRVTDTETGELSGYLVLGLSPSLMDYACILVDYIGEDIGADETESTLYDLLYYGIHFNRDSDARAE
jgi:hypothetical protein